MSEKAQVEWSRCRPYIEAAVSRAGACFETIEDVERHLNEGKYQFWPGRACACVTEIQEYDQKKILCVIHGGGDLVELVDEMEPALCDFARASGCELMAGIGRKGWERVLERRGYRLGFIFMVKNLYH